MAESTNLADQAVQALAAVRAMDARIDLDHPERHSVRALKRHAENILARAFQQAQELVYIAADLTALVENVRAEQASLTAEPGGEGKQP